MPARMSLSGANRKTSTVELRELLNATERKRLLEQLGAKRGVCSAFFSADDPRRLSIDYDADVVSALGLLDFFESCALHAQWSLRQERRGPLPVPPTQISISVAVGAGDRAIQSLT